MARLDPNEAARVRAAALPRNRWIVTGTTTTEPYPCRCKERPLWARGRADWECSAAWCPCAGRSDPQEPDCCGWRRSPAEVVQAKAVWDLQRRQREEIL
jgi:hypothetical protein